MSEPWHGTPGGRSNHNCTCGDCRAAWAAYQKERRDIRSQNIPADKHGTLSGYFNYSCRCQDCRGANSARKREVNHGAELRKQGSVSPLDPETLSQIPALRAKGLAMSAIAKRLKIGIGAVEYHLRRGNAS